MRWMHGNINTGSCCPSCGGGGAALANGTGATGGGGGGSGGYFKVFVTPAQVGVGQTVTIGTGGASETAGGTTDVGKRMQNVRTIYDLDARFRMMDEFDDYAQVISLGLPPLEGMTGPERTPEFARAANDGDDRQP